ncbi:MAG: ComEC family competence protein [Parafilimonas sp.]|nr:ComEC family competence protein [Parafilimonas sp.]
MPKLTAVPVRSLPFLRLVIALISGIIVQWYSRLSLGPILIITCFTIISALVFRLLPLSKKFILSWFSGFLILLLFFSAGMFITWQQNIHNDEHGYSQIYKSTDEVLITIKEPLVAKTNSYKALAEVTAVNKNHGWTATTGNVLLYFKKENNKPLLKYGSQIISHQILQPIQNSGNPAALNYNRYCLFQNVTAQVFLSSKSYIILPAKNQIAFQQILFNTRDWALNILRQNIHSSKELGIAEALLIGYRNDLDKDLVQAYSNTGVVHIIAISGLHIGVIYSALLLFFSIFKTSKLKRWIEPITILVIIWFFTLIAGAAPSILRATVMFTFILLGKFLGRRGNMYNTLAASAFFLLLFNPFYLWDVGFQLSYMAVLSIILFFKSISNLLYFKNRILRWIWQLSAVSLSAQIFTMPLVIYHFHQLPVMFMFSNLLVVPLSGIILFEELLLFCTAWWHAAATLIGWLTEISLRWMNAFVEHINRFPFAVWDGLHISIVQLIIMLICISCISFWIFRRSNKYLIAALSFAILFFIIRDVDLIHHKLQQKLIVYNVPKLNAMDIIAGSNCIFLGDSVVLQDAFLRNFNLKPARIKNRVYSANDIVLPDINNYVLKVKNTKILILGKAIHENMSKEKITINVLILSDNFNQSPAYINKLFKCDYIVANSSVPSWKSAKWKKEFEQLHLRFYSVPQDGAFTLKL